MNTLTKLSTAALLASGLFVTSTAMAAVTPKVKADSFTVSNTAPSTFDVAANDVPPDAGDYKAGKASFGTVSCDTAGACTYTPICKRLKAKKLIPSAIPLPTKMLKAKHVN